MTTRTIVAQVGRGGRSFEIARRLENAIRLGVIPPGTRLPSETVLAEQLQVSPVTLREALSALREAALIDTRRGRGGGSFVRDDAGSHSGDLRARLLSLSPHEIRDLQDQRSAVSATAARLAAARATPAAIGEIVTAVTQLAAATELRDLRQADTRFHVEVAAAAESPRLTAQVLDLWAQIGDLVWLPTEGREHSDLVKIRSDIVAAIAAGARTRAENLTRTLIDDETARLLAHRHRLSRVPVRDHTARRASGEIGSVDDAGAVLRECAEILTGLFGVLDEISSTAQAVMTSARTDAGTITATAFEALNPDIRAHLAQNAAAAAGLGVVVAPAAVERGQPVIQWFWHNGDGIPTRLHVNLNPSDPFYFDYTTTPWYVTARTHRSHSATGPYVDYVCSNEFVYTLTAPLQVDGQFCGVAAADVRGDLVERLIATRLAQLGVAVAVITTDMQVVGSNDVSLPAGSRLSRKMITERLAADERLGWSLVRL